MRVWRCSDVREICLHHRLRWKAEINLPCAARAVEEQPHRKFKPGTILKQIAAKECETSSDFVLFAAEVDCLGPADRRSASARFRPIEEGNRDPDVLRAAARARTATYLPPEGRSQPAGLRRKQMSLPERLTCDLVIPFNDGVRTAWFKIGDQLFLPRRPCNRDVSPLPSSETEMQLFRVLGKEPASRARNWTAPFTSTRAPIPSRFDSFPLSRIAIAGRPSVQSFCIARTCGPSRLFRIRSGLPSPSKSVTANERVSSAKSSPLIPDAS